MKSYFLKFILAILFIVFFNAMFFLFIGIDCEIKSVWISYGFIHVAYVWVLLNFLCKTKGEAGYFLTLTSLMPAWSYFCLELVLGVVFILWAPTDYMWATLSQSILAFIFIVINIVHILAGEATANSLQQRHDEIRPYKEIVADLRALQAMTTDKQLNTILNDCYMVLSTSGMRQIPESRSIDTEISLMIGLIKQNAMTNPALAVESAQQLLQLTKNRQNLLKYSH